MSAPNNGAKSTSELLNLVRQRVGAGYTKLAVLEQVESSTAEPGAHEAAYDLLNELYPAQSIREEDDDYEGLGTEPTLPEECWRGYFANYRDYAEPTTEAPSVYHFSVSLTVAGCCIGRDVGVPNGQQPLFPNFFCVNSGRSGLARKDTATSGGTRLLPKIYMPDPRESDEESPEFQVVSGIRSAEGLLEALKGEDKRRLLKLSELLSLTAKARQESGAAIKPLLTEAWDNPAILNPVIKGNPPTAIRPFLSVLASSTLAWLNDCFSDVDIAGGFAPRFMFFHGNPTRVIPRPPSPDRELRDEILRRLNGLRQHARELRTHANADDDYFSVCENPRAGQMYDAWYVDLHTKLREETIVGTLLNRLPANVRKAALVYALLDGRSVIMPDDMSSAIALGGYLEATVRYIFAGGALNKHTQRERRVVQLLREAGKPLTARALSRALGLNAREFREVIDPMLKLELIHATKGGRSDSTLYALPHGGVHLGREIPKTYSYVPPVYDD